MTKAVLPAMMAEGRGHIVNISSVAGRFGAMFSATYSATKHALHVRRNQDLFWFKKMIPCFYAYLFIF